MVWCLFLPQLDESHFPTAETDSDILKNRKVEHFGYRYDYAINGVHRNEPLLQKPLPKICVELLKDLRARGDLSEESFPNQLTVNRYDVGAGESIDRLHERVDAYFIYSVFIAESPLMPPSSILSFRSAGIPAHCDTHSMFSSRIVVVSLGASIMMDFCGDGRQVSVVIPRRSVTLVQDESRYGWTHRSVISLSQSELIEKNSYSKYLCSKLGESTFNIRSSVQIERKNGGSRGLS